MEPKKISFGFSKIKQKSNLLPTKEKKETNVELIKCLEGQEIKLVEEKPATTLLVIPLKESQTTSSALASLMKRRAVLLGKDEEIEVNNDNANKPHTFTKNGDTDDIEKRAARELLAEIQNNGSEGPESNLVLPVKADDLPLEGAIESTLDDYESIPVQGFGIAMLRGMGWSKPPPKTNKKGDLIIDDTPTLRPIGMGLGADKALKKKTLVAPEPNEKLEMKRDACVRILGGKHKDLYGKVEGFGDYAGRVIVKMAIGGAKEAFSEFLCQPVSKKEYAQYGKCINNSKYEEYKKTEHDQSISYKDKISTEKSEKNVKEERQGSVQMKHLYTISDHRRHQKEGFVEDKKCLKKESNSYREQQKESYNYDVRDHNERDKESRDFNKYSRNEDKDSARDDKRPYHRKEHHKSDNSHRQKDHDRYESKSNYSCSQIFSRNDATEHENRDTREREESVQQQHNTESYKSRYKSNDLDKSFNSESKSYISKHKKSRKAILKKKSKKTRNNSQLSSSDTETTSSTSNSSSDSEEEKRKKRKKKTKKSKRQRERSRSRGRR